MSERQGRVVTARSPSFKALEATARQTNAKGAYFDRGAHKAAAEIQAWLDATEEADFMHGQVATVQLLVAPLLPEMDSDGEEVPPPFDPSDIEIAKPADIRAACEQLVSELPKSFREAVRKDAEALVGVVKGAAPGIPWVTLRLEMVQHNACWRWHQDAYAGRAIISYVGPGTFAADDKAVLWDKYEESMGQESNLEAVPEEGVKKMTTNSVLLMKGDTWPGLRGSGLTHKSPDVPGDPPPKRLLLKVDLATTCPPMFFGEFDGEFDSEEEEGVEGEEKEKEEDEPAAAGAGRRAPKTKKQSAALKRLADSEGLVSSESPSKRRR